MTTALVYVVVTIDDATGAIADMELLDSAPRWDGNDLPVGFTQVVRSGYVNGGDSIEERVIVGTNPRTTN